MLPTTIITLACLWLCPTDPWIQINLWDSHPPQPIETKVKTEPEFRPAATPRPNPPPPADPPSSSSGVEQWRILITVHFGDETERALCLMGYESDGDPGARNPSSGAAGLMQVMPFWAPEYGVSYDALFDPDTNIRIAKGIRDSQGWDAWAPYNRGACH